MRVSGQCWTSSQVCLLKLLLPGSNNEIKVQSFAGSEVSQERRKQLPIPRAPARPRYLPALESRDSLN